MTVEQLRRESMAEGARGRDQPWSADDGAVRKENDARWSRKEKGGKEKRRQGLGLPPEGERKQEESCGAEAQRGNKGERERVCEEAGRGRGEPSLPEVGTRRGA